ncbi:hypothetical protein [Bradyrhizobium sp. SZCCHNR3003]|uniref:hypothetical protein n=1 Tax=Bradyrhizobium sp. SZCCHNR3003 TaxID=3057387 RepID=UPI002916317A|nr:hypothetical protein [Bradyrhizobium sp. SZCCHNR3003]
MPKTDYDDPEVPFPRLQARVQLLEGGTFWIQIWLWERPGGPREEKMNGKRAGNVNDAHEYLRKYAILTGAEIDPDDITFEDRSIPS